MFLTTSRDIVNDDGGDGDGDGDGVMEMGMAPDASVMTQSVHVIIFGQFGKPAART